MADQHALPWRRGVGVTEIRVSLLAAAVMQVGSARAPPRGEHLIDFIRRLVGAVIVDGIHGVVVVTRERETADIRQWIVGCQRLPDRAYLARGDDIAGIWCAAPVRQNLVDDLWCAARREALRKI